MTSILFHRPTDSPHHDPPADTAGTIRPRPPVVFVDADLVDLATRANHFAAGRHRYTTDVRADDPDVVVIGPDALDRLSTIRLVSPDAAVVVYDTGVTTPGSFVAGALAGGIDAYVTQATPAVLVAQIDALLRSHPAIFDGAAAAAPPMPTAFDAPVPDAHTVAAGRTSPDLRPRGGSRAIATAGVLAACLVVGAGAGYVAGGMAGSSTTEAPTSTGLTVAAATAETDVAAVIDQLTNSVVSIGTTVLVRQGPFQAESSGAGTGVVLDDGYILTNAHVVDGATDITITTGDGAEITATLLAADAASDIAVLAADTTGLDPIPVADTTTVAVGDTVIAIGNALDLDGSLTVTQGIISALDRSVELDTGTLGSLIQTDAAISSGNSGGPLVNSSGEVVGINTAVAASSSSVQASNIGFAISIDQALAVASDLLGATT